MGPAVLVVVCQVPGSGWAMLCVSGKNGLACSEDGTGQYKSQQPQTRGVLQELSQLGFFCPPRKVLGVDVQGKGRLGVRRGLPGWFASSGCPKPILRKLWLMYVTHRCNQPSFLVRYFYLSPKQQGWQTAGTGEEKNSVSWALHPWVHAGMSLYSPEIRSRDLCPWLWLCCPWILFEYTPSWSCFAFHQGVFCLKGIAATAKWSVSLPLRSPVDITFHYPDEPERVLPLVLICPQASLCHVRKKPVTFSSLPHPSCFGNLE